jgi:apurinic endonuclease APN1
MRYWGCHVSVSGGLPNGIRNGTDLGVNAIQIHPSPPQRWNKKPFVEDTAGQFLEEWKHSKIEKVFFHAIYLINLANPDPEQLKKSTTSLTYYLDLMGQIKGDGVVVHVGSNKYQSSEQAGFNQVAESINRILGDSNPNAQLLLEVSAGSGKIIGSRLEELAGIYDMVEDKQRVGFALDSQHMWASGYDFENNLPGVIKDLKKWFGLKKIKLFHLNDSKTALDSKVDRHANLGEGLIGKKTLKSIVNHPDLKKIPFVLETPALKDIETAKKEVKIFKRMIEF